MDLNGKHIAILVDNYFEQAEFEEPLTAMKNAGAEVSVISTKGKEVQAMHHADKGDVFSVDLIIDQASSDDYDALILPGGAINADALRMNEAAQGWVIDFLNSGRPLAVICHAPWLLVSADCVEGRRLTSYETIQDDIRNAGAEWVNSPLVLDGNLITSRKPDDLPEFNDAIIKMLSQKTSVATAAAADLPYLGSEKELEENIRFKAMGYDNTKDEIGQAGAQDIMVDEMDSDPDEFYPSSIQAEDEKDGNQ